MDKSKKNDRQIAVLVGILLLAIGTRIYLARSAPPTSNLNWLAPWDAIRNLQWSPVLLVGVAAAATTALIGLRFLPRISSFLLAGIASGLVLASHDPVLGLGIGLGVGAFVAFRFVRVLALMCVLAILAMAYGLAGGAAALAVDHNYDSVPDLLSCAVLAATMGMAGAYFFVPWFHRRRSADQQRRARLFHRLSLLFMVAVGMSLGPTFLTVWRIKNLDNWSNAHVSDRNRRWLWPGPVELMTFGSRGRATTESQLRAMSRFTEIHTAYLYQTPLHGRMQYLESLRNLRNLELADTLIVDEDLKHLEGLTKLGYLNLDEN
jgi:hypothetical protein